MILSLALVAAGVPYLALGAVHALYAWQDRVEPRRFAPDDPAVLAGMQRATIRLTRGATTVWRGGLGFHFSHSMGAILFGALAVMAGTLGDPRALPLAAFVVALLWSVLYALLAWHYWFRIPLLGTAAATLAFALALVARIAG